MARTIPAATQAGLEERAASEFILTFLTLAHPELGDAVRLVSDDVDYLRASGLFYGTRFRLSRPGDDESMSRGRLTLPNVSWYIGQFITSISTPMTCRIELLARSNFTLYPDENGQITVLDSEVVLYSSQLLQLRGVTLNQSVAEGELITTDLSTVPAFPVRTTRERAPGLFL